MTFSFDQLVDLYAAWPIYVILAGLMVLDVISGVLAAFGTKTLNSTVSWLGIAKKLGTWVFVATALLVERLLGGQIPLGVLTATGFCVTEGLSILENGHRMGLLPPFILREALEKLNSQVTATVSAPASSEVEITAKPRETAIPGGQRRDDPPAVE